MNENNPNPQPEKSGLDDKKKTALLRYIAILFAVAFLFVLFSMLAQMRDSKMTISELNQSSNNTLQKAEQLQIDYQLLQEENNELKAQIKSMGQQLEQLQEQLEDTEHSDTQTIRLQSQLTEAEALQKKITQAYENLLTALESTTPGSQEGNVAVSKALENLEELKQYLGQNGLEEYNALLEEGE